MAPEVLKLVNTLSILTLFLRNDHVRNSLSNTLLLNNLLKISLLLLMWEMEFLKETIPDDTLPI